MKKTVLLNAPVSHVIATMGHTDSLTICDAGLPIPTTQHCIDLALVKGLPSFIATLDAVLNELFIEKIVLAEEIKHHNIVIAQQLFDLIHRTSELQGRSIEISYVPHSLFKETSNQAKAVIRTGECTPYANVILYSGVPF